MNQHRQTIIERAATMNSVPEQLVGRSSIFKPYPYARLPQSTSASIRLPALLAVAILGAVPVMVPTPTTPFLLISVLIPASTVAPSQLLLVGLLLSTDVVVSVRIASLSCEALLHVPVCHVLHSSCLLLIRLRKLPKGSLLQAHKLLGLLHWLVALGVRHCFLIRGCTVSLHVLASTAEALHRRTFRALHVRLVRGSWAHLHWVGTVGTQVTCLPTIVA
mmetsp:Transcript_15893/g.30636  ORF Transcript_15893/g.30636 Transcript_15893/m.30636 type:complete len:219 (-) Transcript_15893:47-703(-)